MKIKLAILYPDKKHLNKIVSALNNRYAEKLEIYSYTDYEAAMENIRKNRIRVFLASESCEIDLAGIDRCGFAYLTETKGLVEIFGQRAVCMLLKTEEIYKDIVELYTSVGGEWGTRSEEDGTCSVIAFCAAAGGVGASSMAAACAMRAAARHKKVLYLNLEKFGDAQQYFTAEGQYGMSDVIYAVKGRKTALRGKLVSGIRIDPDSEGGVLTRFEGVELNALWPWQERMVPTPGQAMVLLCLPVVAAAVIGQGLKWKRGIY